MTVRDQDAIEAGDARGLVSVRGVSRDFGHGDRQVRAVDQVDLDVPAGQCLGLVGESGSGKSTLVRLIMNLDRPTAGSLSFDGTDLARLRRQSLRAFRRRAQMVFQDPYGSLVPTLTAADNVAEPLRIHRIGSRAERRRRAVELLRRVGIPAGSAELYPRQFSGGQQQRIAIARALALEPDLLVCDEPTSALDVSVQAQVLQLLAELRAERGLTMIVISHNLAVVEYLADHVTVMRRGRVVESAPAGTLFADPRHCYTRRLMDSVLPVRGAAPPARRSGAPALGAESPQDDGLLAMVAANHLVRE